MHLIFKDMDGLREVLGQMYRQFLSYDLLGGNHILSYIMNMRNISTADNGAAHYQCCLKNIIIVDKMVS